MLTFYLKLTENYKTVNFKMIQSAFGNLASIPCISNVVAKKHLKLKLNQCFLLQSFKYKAPSTAAKWRKTLTFLWCLF